MRDLISTMAQRLDRLQRQRPTATHHDTLNYTKTIEDCLIIGNSTQRADPRQIKTRAFQRAGACSIGKQETSIANLPSALQLSNMLTRLDADDPLRQETDVAVLVKTRGPRPQFIFAHTPCQIVFQRRSIKDRKRIISNHRDCRS